MVMWWFCFVFDGSVLFGGVGLVIRCGVWC